MNFKNKKMQMGLEVKTRLGELSSILLKKKKPKKIHFYHAIYGCTATNMNGKDCIINFARCLLDMI